MTSYAEFLDRKMQNENENGFLPIWIPDFLFDFQKSLVDWSVRKGRAAIFADCGMGKTPIQLVWAENVIRHTNKHVLIATPLAVGLQTIHEARKFGINATRMRSGLISSEPQIVVTNYEQLRHFDPRDFSGMVCDESSILKNFDGSRRAVITEFIRTLPYRLLCTATASPNDYIELGTSSEALGVLGHIDMLHRFFKNDQNTHNTNRLWAGAKWRFKPHAEHPFWRWVCSWARAARRPSDLGFEDKSFILPELSEVEHVVKAARPKGDFLFDLPAVGLKEQRDERRHTIQERCEKVAGLVAPHEVSISWCHLNPEGDLLEKLIPNSIQISGVDCDQEKEEKLSAFINGERARLISKPVVAGFGLNLQHCAHVTTFPSHSFESYYQSIRRCWRFGQTRPVVVDLIITEGERGVMANLQRKSYQADRMFEHLVTYMNDSLGFKRENIFRSKEETPAWL